MAKGKIGTGQLATDSGVSRSQIQRILLGGQPRLDTLRALTEVLEKAIAKEQPAKAADVRSEGIAA